MERRLAAILATDVVGY